MLLEELKTERLILRKLTPDVYTYVFENYSDDELINFFAFESADVLAAEKDKLKKGLWTHNKSFVNFKLFDRQTMQHTGNCGFHTWYLPHFRAEIGYDISQQDMKEKGLMTEALQTIIPYGFNEMKLNRIEAFIGSQNQASLKLMQKFGFNQEGLMRQHYCKNGEIQDSLVFSLLKHEYKF